MMIMDLLSGIKRMDLQSRSGCSWADPMAHRSAVMIDLSSLGQWVKDVPVHRVEYGSVFAPKMESAGKCEKYVVTWFIGVERGEEDRCIETFNLFSSVRSCLGGASGLDSRGYLDKRAAMSASNEPCE